MLLRGLDAEILMRPRQLFDAAVEEHEVVHQLEQPLLGAHLEQVLVELEAAVVLLVFLPPEKILLRRADRAVLQAFGVVAGEDELHRAEEPLVEFRLLVGEALADAVADGDAAVLQLDHADGDAVDIEHEIGPPLVIALSVTSSAMAKSFFSGWLQSMRWTVSVTLPASIFTGTP